MRRHAILPIMLAATVPAAAQDPGISQSWSSTQLLLNSEKRAWAAPECVNEGRWSIECGDAPRAKPPSTHDAREAAADGLRFSYSAKRRRANEARFVARVGGADPAARRAMEAFLAQDVVDAVGREVTKYGLRVDDLADATAIYVGEVWDVIHARTTTPTPALMQALSRQMARAIRTGGLDGGDDATRQELAEAMIIQATLISSSAAQAKRTGDGTEAERIRDLALQGSRATLGIDLSTMDMTGAGLVERPARR